MGRPWSAPSSLRGPPPPCRPPARLQALRQRSGALSQLLLQRYKPSLDRDPGLWALAMRARAAHVPAAPAGGMGGLFGDMLKSMFAPPPPPPRPQA